MLAMLNRGGADGRCESRRMMLCLRSWSKEGSSLGGSSERCRLRCPGQARAGPVIVPELAAKSGDGSCTRGGVLMSSGIYAASCAGCCAVHERAVGVQRSDVVEVMP